MLAAYKTGTGLLRGMLVLAALWWAWNVYAWLTSTIDVDEGGVRLVMLASMAAMFGVALAVSGAFGDEGVLLGAAYLLVRLIHIVLSAVLGHDDRRAAVPLYDSRRPRFLAPRCSSLPASSKETHASRCGWLPSQSTGSARRDRHGERLDDRPGALRRAPRSDHPDRPRRVDDRHRRGSRVRAPNRGHRRGGAGNGRGSY